MPLVLGRVADAVCVTALPTELHPLAMKVRINPRDNSVIKRIEDLFLPNICLKIASTYKAFYYSQFVSIILNKLVRLSRALRGITITIPMMI